MISASRDGPINNSSVNDMFFSVIKSIALTLIISAASLTIYAEELWQIGHIFQTNIQSYNGTDDRKNANNIGYMISGHYLDSGSLSVGIDHTSVNLGNNADVDEELFFLSGEYHLYPDYLPGKLTLRFDAYFGKDRLEYSLSSPPPSTPGPSPGPGPGFGKIKTTRAATDTVTESIDINSYYLHSAFINYKKTYYTDIGYAYSEYNATSDTIAHQITPSVGMSWNNSYDWLLWRAYIIKLDEDTPAYGKDRFESIEVKYSHWFPDEPETSIELIELTLMSGERVLAVDPTTTTIYSITDKQKTSLSGGIQWKLSKNTKSMAVIQYDQYRNITLSDNYESFLFYINLQFRNY